MPNTKGFDAQELAPHFAEHGADFGAITMAEYERIADAMWNNPMPAHVHECFRPQGGAVRFDPTTDAYCVLGSDKKLKTFFKPVPCVTIQEPQRTVMKREGRCHPQPDNMTYFKVRCL
jgi:pyocin large subunit-like protein